MDFTKLLDILQNLTTQKVSLSKIGEILAVTRSNISKRVKSGSEVTVSELRKIEKHFGINIYKSDCYTGERQFDENIELKLAQFGKRLSKLQQQYNFLDREMAQILNITEKAYIALAIGDAKPNIEVIHKIKQNFKISTDYLLYGE